MTKNNINKKVGVLFVCLGNICRSPLGEGVFRHLVEEAGLSDKFHIDSAGTAGYHIGDKPDPGSIRVAKMNGISIDGQRGRKLTTEDLEKWNYIIAMDRSNYNNIKRLGEVKGKLSLMRDFDPEGRGDVPDPWAQGPEAFREVYEIIKRSAEKLLDEIIMEQEISNTREYKFV